MTAHRSGKPTKQISDRDQAVRFLAIKAAVFILVPLVIAIATAIWVLQ